MIKIENLEVWGFRGAIRGMRNPMDSWDKLDTVFDEKGNVIKLEHNQFVSTNRNAAVELRITMESYGTEHKREILKALEDNGYKPKSISAKLY